MKAASIIAASVAAALLAPCAALADNSAAVQARVNSIVVQQAVQQSLQNQLNGQASALQAQQNAMQLQIRNGIQAQNLTVQQILLEQRLQLIELRMRAVTPTQAHPAGSRARAARARPHSPQP